MRFSEGYSPSDKKTLRIGRPWKIISKPNLLADELLKPPKISNINNPALSQPICTALQIALVELLKSFNLSHSAVVGHSSGEIAAA